MSSAKKMGRWNRFEIAFNDGAWPKPSFSPSEKKQSLRKIVKETPGSSFADLALWGATPTRNVASSDETPNEPSPEEKTSFPGAAPSPTLWTEARRETKGARKGRTRR